MSKLKIGYFYRDSLNLYGDNGNVEILEYRAKKRGFDVEKVFISEKSPINIVAVEGINLVFMGGGPDSSQNNIYKDLLEDKASFIRSYIEKEGVGLFICGSFQLLGDYYKDSEGKILQGLSIFSAYTEHFGKQKSRCIGNTVGLLSTKITESEVFKNLGGSVKTIVGFENHGGRTFLKPGGESFAKILKGQGNNSLDKTEGCLYKNAIGSYFHGPVLSKNPHLADYLLAKALKLDKLEPLNDELIYSAHTALLKK